MKFKDIKQYGDLNNQTYRNSIDLESSMITSLEGSPKKIEGYFNCRRNKLQTLKGCPKEINGFFDCSNNKLISLENSPKKIKGIFYRMNNSLNSLYGSPEEIKESFYCDNNDLVTLEYCTKNIGKTFSCKGNKKLKNVKEQIIKHQIKAKIYITDESSFSFEDIKKEFDEYGEYLKKEQTNKNKQIKSTDYGLSI